MMFPTQVVQLIVICIKFFSCIEVRAEDTRPNIIIMQPDDFDFFDRWSPPPHEPIDFPKYGLPNIERVSYIHRFITAVLTFEISPKITSFI